MKIVSILKNIIPDPSRHPSAWNTKPIKELPWNDEREEEEDSSDPT